MKKKLGVFSAIIVFILSLASFLDQWYLPFALLSDVLTYIGLDFTQFSVLLSLLYAVVLIVRNIVQGDEE